MYSIETKRRKCGVWMDHAQAHVMDLHDQEYKVFTIKNEHESRERFSGEGSDGSVLGRHRSMNTESVKNARKAEKLHEYYGHLAKTLQVFDDIFVFGPTTAPKEFCNYLSNLKSFQSKHILTESSDYISTPQMIQYVRNHFHLVR